MRRIWRISSLAAAAAVLGASLTGCGYQLAGRGSFLPPHISRIGVPPFDSLVPRVEVTERLTAAVTKELVSRRRYTIVPTTRDVDAVLLGTVMGLVVTPIALDSSGRQSRALVTVTASVKLHDKQSDKILYENPAFQFRAEIDLIQSDAAYTDPEFEAIDAIARDFARSLTATIMEGF